eukprot:CAMPEP_0184351316 /NCGR_PEP_ID=MMETSP1089-20130417/43546_1 /TAXON_ID=38269 ORGANISM="Gloeochaete wittrockiana, Strain SAG46.84" /NCGR_SAMPLE_ID=MMETSP1089 /ASSEMBLY_ACC=CAM_ASM_000445 /LENGTH=180 /DNA_ID=CAMNT_0026684631 /DNA_START=142 /DNA_END=681 /DNA_ORIENTATION=-
MSRSYLQKTQPINWPADVAFVSIEYDTTVPKAQRLLSQSKPCSVVRIKKISDASHPACGQYGLFASKDLPLGTHLLTYGGFVTAASCASKTSDYVLSLGADWAIDAERMGNEARFINDYRGIKDRPNCLFEFGKVVTAKIPTMDVFVGPIPIKKGEELLVTYGRSFWKARRENEGEISVE